MSWVKGRSSLIMCVSAERLKSAAILLTACAIHCLFGVIVFS